MNLTEQDIKSLETIYELANARSKAHAVGIALRLTGYIFEHLSKEEGANLLFRKPDGKVERILIPELVSRRSGHQE